MPIWQEKYIKRKSILGTSKESTLSLLRMALKISIDIQESLVKTISLEPGGGIG